MPSSSLPFRADRASGVNRHRSQPSSCARILHTEPASARFTPLAHSAARGGISRYPYAVRRYDNDAQVRVSAPSALRTQERPEKRPPGSCTESLRAGWTRNGSTTLESYALDALNRRITENPGTARSLFYSAQWQVLEEREGSVVKVQMVWSPVYIDAMVLRDRDADGNSGNGLEERLYLQQDTNFNASAVINASGVVQERFVLDAYGLPSFKAADWTSRTSSSYGWVYLHQGGRLSMVRIAYHFRSRELLPTLGCWGQVDPIDFLGRDPNLLRYTGNSPVAKRDPSGLFSDKGFEGFRPKPPPWTPLGNGYPARVSFEVCGAGESTLLRRSLQGACDCINKAIKLIRNYWGTIAKLYTGPQMMLLLTNQKYYLDILERAAKACSSMHSKFSFYCISPDQACLNRCGSDRDVLAYAGDATLPGGDYHCTIYICPRFFRRPYRPDPDTIVHEFARCFGYNEITEKDTENRRDINVWDTILDKLCRHYEMIVNAAHNEPTEPQTVSVSLGRSQE